MSFAFQADESVENGMRRVAGKQLEHLLALLSRKGGAGQNRGVHEARKRLKKLRALLKLLRPALGKKQFERYEKLFRDSGRIFSCARDASVLIVTFDRLMEHFHQRRSRTALKAIRGELLKRRRKLLGETSGARDRGKIIKRLREAKRECETWKLKEDGWGAIRDGLRRTYSDGRKAFKSADRDPADEKLHEWRKRTKDLCHELQLLRESWPQELQTMAEEAHQLADWLGEDHDLAMLRDALGDEQAGLVEDFVQTRRKRLQAEAMALGSRLFSRKPAVFVRQIHDFWKLWREKPVILTLQAGGSNF